MFDGKTASLGRNGSIRYEAARPIKGRRRIASCMIWRSNKVLIEEENYFTAFESVAKNCMG
jgi:hypothetical protein